MWGDVELAWRLRGRPDAAPWLAVTGTNGKTTTVQMLAVHPAAPPACAPPPSATSASPLHRRRARRGARTTCSPSSCPATSCTGRPRLRAHSAAVLNLAPDHLDWHGSMEAYAADKGRIYEGNQVACVYNAADPATEDLVREADVEEGCRAIGFTLGTPGPSQLGVVDGILVDRAFVDDRQKQAQELAEVADVDPPAPHNIANALAAAALARAYGVPPARRTRRAARLPPRRPPHRARRGRRRRRLRRRLQGHQHPRRAGLAGRVRVDRVDRRRPRQGRHVRRTRHGSPRRGCAAPC